MVVQTAEAFVGVEGPIDRCLSDIAGGFCGISNKS